LVYIKKDLVYKYSVETLEKLAQNNKIWYEENKWKTISLSELSLNSFDADGEFDADRSRDAVRSGGKKMINDKKINSNGKLKIPVPHKHFSHLFNAYSRYLQIRTGRTGNLFERPFKRKLIDNEEYLKTAVLYIHNNPVHHDFCSHPLEYPWTSYLTSISNRPTKLKRDEVIKLFSNKENFEHQHNQKIDIGQIEKWLEIAPSDLHDLDLSKDDADREFDADRSGDAVRSGEVAVNFDLSAYAVPDNVKILEDNVKMMKDSDLN
jgi:hypothetical protein